MTIGAALRHGARVLLVAALVVACGGPSPSPLTVSEPATTAACDLVPDMDALVGRTAVAPPSSYAVGSSERCLWVYVTDPSRYVAMTLGPSSSHGDTIGSFGDGEVIEAVGDEARWWASNLTLSVIVGNRSLQVDLQLDDAEDPRALAESIAVAALENLR